MNAPAASTEAILQLRSARNRMIDLLGLAETYPVRDLPVPNEHLTVAFNETAAIKVQDSEKQLVYTLRDKDGHNAGAAVTGTGGTIVLTTPAITNDITYTIHARTPAGREADLIGTATVKVGLDLSLAAVVLPADGPSPRLLDFGATVMVQIPFSQDGVDYRLVRFAGGVPAHPDDMTAAAQDDIVSDGDHTVRGTGGPIQLPSKPLQNDTELRIRAIKIFDGALARPPQTNILAVRLPVYVRANGGLAISSDPGPIFDFQAARFLRVAAAQAGVEYRAVLWRVPDAAFVQGAAAAPDIIAVPVPGQPDALIRLPSVAGTNASDVPSGFTAAPNWQAGTGQDLRLALPAADADSVVVVAARKTHAIPSGQFVSTVWLRQMIAQLVRPNPSPPLALSTIIAAGSTDGTLSISGGQPGVFYTPRLAPNGAPFTPGAYAHQRNPDDPASNKGIGQLELEVDFVVAREGQPPLPPVLATAAIAVGATVTIQAMKAQSRVAIDLPVTAVITAAPAAQLDTPLVDHGGSVHVRVPASLATESYALFRHGAPDDIPIGPARDGNGQTLDFPSVPLDRDTVLVLYAANKVAIPVRRGTLLNVAVRPDPALTVRAQNATVPSGTVTAILVEASEPGVGYQVFANGIAVGTALAGTGATLALPVGPITATTAFSVKATRLSEPAASVSLAQTATITVAPN